MVRPVDEENDYEFAPLSPERRQTLISQGGTTSGSGTSSAPMAQPQGKGSGFVNASDYLEANKGKGAALGEMITAEATKAGQDFDTGFKGLRDISMTGIPGDRAVRESFRPLTDKRKDDVSEYAGFKDYLDRGGGGKIEIGGYNADDIERQSNALQGLRNSVSTYDKALSENPNSKTTRSQLLREKADQAVKSGNIGSYNENQQAFDTMFMEAESPDLIQRKSEQLRGLLGSYSADDIGRIAAEKTGSYNATKADADLLNAEMDIIKANYGDAARKKEMADARAGNTGIGPDTFPGDSGGMPQGPDSSSQTSQPGSGSTPSSQQSGGRGGFGGGGGDSGQTAGQTVDDLLRQAERLKNRSSTYNR